jgi:hypothetical protein
MRKRRYQRGSVKRQNGRWVGMWYADNGGRKSRVLGLVKDMTKSDARAAVNKIATEVNAKQDQRRVWTFGEFVTEVYFEFYRRTWKQCADQLGHSLDTNQNVYASTSVESRLVGLNQLEQSLRATHSP